MKKIKKIISAILLVLLAACSSEEPAMQVEVSKTEVSYTRTPEEAIALASQFADISSNGASRSSKRVVDR